jgi:pimeloyl-ACP methyl ester carboxylesterase
MQTHTQNFNDPATAIEKLGLKEWVARSMNNRLDLAKADPKIVEWYINENAKTRQDVAIKIMRFLQVADISQGLSNIKVPTLLLVGDKSPICPLEQQRFMAQQIPNAKLVVFENIGHGIQLLMADRCVKEINTFLQTID